MKRMGRLELSMRKLLAPPHNQSTERVGTPGHIPSPLITFLPPTLRTRSRGSLWSQFTHFMP
jgi:hypothetical protein